jgi:hypothetical protein
MASLLPEGQAGDESDGGEIMDKPKITPEFLEKVGRLAEAANEELSDGAAMINAVGSMGTIKLAYLKYIAFMDPDTALALKARIEELGDALRAIAMEPPIHKIDARYIARQALKEDDDD